MNKNKLDDNQIEHQRSYYQCREDINIFFRKMPLALFLDLLLGGRSFEEAFLIKDDCSEALEKLYERVGSETLNNTTPDERVMRFRGAWNLSHKEKGMYFSLLWKYADQVLDHTGKGICCKIEKILGWNDITRRVGQDLIVCAWMAHNDLGRGDVSFRDFMWPAVLNTNDRKLNKLMRCGMAENHFHLYGSTQSFFLSWICLMNNPNVGNELDMCETFKYRLTPRIEYGRYENVYKWSELVFYAAYIRVMLFQHCVIETLSCDDVYKTFSNLSAHGNMSMLKRIIVALKNEWGIGFELLNHKKKVLDYAIAKGKIKISEKSPYRALTGERLFLYSCFRKLYKGSMNEYIRDLFHTYLLIKNCFRDEFIMSNKQSGFEIFSLYQDRKDFIFDKITEYDEEAHRLSVGAAMLSGNVRVLEARITPKDSKIEMANKINIIDKKVLHGLNLSRDDERFKYYYVIHFPKTKEKEFPNKIKDNNILSRYSDLREKIEKQARAIQRMRMDNANDLMTQKEKVLALDACASELYCRPEVFGTVFRYATDRYVSHSRQLNDKLKSLKITFHVGEDFLDIVDGLRAIDEAMIFLEMTENDRIGHGTVLGIEADLYYKRKKNTIVMEKQRLLDNFVWLLYSADKWGIDVNDELRSIIEGYIKELIEYIYPIGADDKQNFDDDKSVPIIQSYYESWLLRGDDPELYRNGLFSFSNPDEMNRYFDMSVYYEFYKVCRNNDVCKARESKKANRLYFRYHYDMNARKKGAEIISFEVPKEFIKIVDSLQKKMRRVVSEANIIIECNPTSNLLIGPIEEYHEHPIWRMNHGNLFEKNDETCMKVTINTDDIGVFATSLENEYAVLFQSACRIRHENYNNMDDKDVYVYLNKIRKNGLRFSFYKD